MTVIVERRTYNVKCNDCQEMLFDTGVPTIERTFSEAYRNGWTRLRLACNYADYCPECQEKREESQKPPRAPIEIELSG